MTLDEARENIGCKVIYRTGQRQPEEGVITSVNDSYVFVRYGAQSGSQATLPADLTLLAGDPR